MKKSDDSSTYDYLDTFSATDCTGLIPAAPAGDEELENYNELYPYLPEAAPDMGDHSQNNRDEAQNTSIRHP